MNNRIPKKIVYVSDAIWPFNRGGKEKRLYDITTRLVKEGFDVHIYTMNWWKGPKDIVADGVNIHAIAPLYPLYSGERRSIKEGVLFGLACLKLIKENWDIIDVDHMPYFPLFSCKLVCLLKGKKLIATWHEVWGKEYWIEYLGKFKGNIAYILERFTFLMPDRIIAISELTTNKLRDMGVTQQISTIPIGIDFEHMQSITPAEEKSDAIFVGRFLAHKHVDLLIEAIAKIANTWKQDIKCLLIGKGPELENLNILVNKLGVQKNVIFKGPMEGNQDDVYALMKSSKVFVLPSTREGFGIVAIEANACGLPIIIVNDPSNATKYLIKECENGIITNLNSSDIYTKIKAVINEEITFTNLFKYLDNYFWNNIIQALESVYSR